jgi:threonine aldolase
MALKLKSAVEEIPGITIEVPTDANAVFARLPAEVVERLQDKWRFYTWDSPTLARWMCAWDTQESDVQAFAADIATEMAAYEVSAS